MNAFSQVDIKSTYSCPSMKQVQIFADCGYGDARELLALGLSNDHSNLSQAANHSLLGRISSWFWRYTERLFKSWNRYEQNIGI